MASMSRMFQPSPGESLNPNLKPGTLELEYLIPSKTPTIPKPCKRRTSGERFFSIKRHDQPARKLPMIRSRQSIFAASGLVHM